jgi:rubrerythrin
MSPKIEQMEVETLSKECKEALCALLNKAIQVEYGVILNYPRIIDYLANYEKVNDEIFLADLERLGTDSARHLGCVVEIIRKLGGEPVWQMDTIERLFDAHATGVQQLEKEKMAVELYKQAIHLVRKNLVTEKVRDFAGKLVKTNRNGLQEEVCEACEVITQLERIQIDEVRHVETVHDMLATYDFFKGGES